MSINSSEQAGVSVRVDQSAGVLVLSGEWLLAGERTGASQLLDEAQSEHGLMSICFDVEDLGRWDTALLLFVQDTREWADDAGVEVNLDALPAGAQNMIRLAEAVPDGEGSAIEASPGGFLSKVGEGTIEVSKGLESYFSFLGQLILDLITFIRGKSQIRWKDLLFLFQSTGPKALLIVSLLSFLTGLIIAFIGVIQLQKFAADIFVADLVGLAITRELGPIMVGVIMAGRTGAAFAAQIGSMQVNEEIDALISFGISPMQFLVVPRVIALVIMMPLLCVCADFVGIVGGMVVAVAISDVSFVQYFNQVEIAVSLSDFLSGVFKSGVFGLIIAVAGCYRGLNCGRDATAVGHAATSAVVTSITWIVIADAIFAVSFHLLGI
jgi:phospholipid/cholesterol/gamma-HCH transport system permease protein